MLARITVILLLGAFSRAHAQTHVWVSPTLGSNSASGSTPSAPWRSITHAIGATAGATVIHLLPGTYDAASGEAFPILVRDQVDLVGDGNASEAVIRSYGQASFVLLAPQRASLRDLTIDAGGSGNAVSVGPLPSNTGPSVCDLLRVHITDAVRGVLARSTTLTLDMCAISDCSLSGIVALGFADTTARDCVIEGCGYAGVVGVTSYNLEDLAITLQRCEIVDNDGFGAILETSASFNDSRIRVEDSIIARNGGDGVSMATSASGNEITIEASTIAYNSGRGAVGRAFAPMLLVSSVVAGNALGDVLHVDAFSTLVQDGSGPSGNGNLVGAPGFVGGVAGDLSLRFDSPCVDRGLASAGSGQDRLGQSRTVDGDLDLVGAPDIGALELRTLSGPSEATSGGTGQLFTHGPIGGFSTVVVSHAGYAPFGTTTPYGRFFLQASGAYRLVPIMTTGGEASELTIDVPSDPALVGTSIGYQALTRSTAAPAGGAFSNPILILIR